MRFNTFQRVGGLLLLAMSVQGCLLSRKVLSTSETVRLTVVELREPKWAAWSEDGVLELCVGTATKAGPQDYRWTLPLSGELPEVNPHHAEKWARMEAELVYQTSHWGIPAQDLDMVDRRHQELVDKGCGKAPRGAGWRAIDFRKSTLFGLPLKERSSDPERLRAEHPPGPNGEAVLYLVDGRDVLLSGSAVTERGRLAFELSEVQGRSRRGLLALLPLAALADVVSFPIQVPIVLTTGYEGF